jgi:tRNA (guanine37-N1)-methyltransferase
MTAHRIDVLTLFPAMFEPGLGQSILGRAATDVPDPAAPDDAQRVRRAVVSYHVHNIRQWSRDKHGKVDQPPYGGGPGMVMQCGPVWDAAVAVEAMDDRPATRVLLTPKGVPLTQALAQRLSQRPRLLLIAGHYEGLDQRVIDRLHELPTPPSDEHGEGDDGLLEVSLGDYVLSGGELPAMVLIDAVVRLLPGVLGDERSHAEDSFAEAAGGLLDHPHYTRPAVWEGREVPAVLSGGDHVRIAAWRRAQAERLTRERRPELMGDAAGAGEGQATPLVIRTAERADAVSIDEVLVEAFGGDDEAKLVRRLRKAGDAAIELVAERDQRVIGHVLLSPLGCVAEDGHVDRGMLALAPLAVRPAWQRMGIGEALTRAAIRQAQRTRCPAVVVLGDPPYYRRFGFEPAHAAGYTSPFDAAGDALQVLPLSDPPPAGGRLEYAKAFEGT